MKNTEQEHGLFINIKEDRNNKPVEIFKNNEELNTYLKEWQRKLYLDTWSIRAILSNDEKLALICSGDIEFERTHESAIINIYNKFDSSDPRFNVKVPQELTLVHELLHISFNLDEKYETIEQKEYYDYYHNLLNKMAKALLAEKYRFDRDWFKND